MRPGDGDTAAPLPITTKHGSHLWNTSEDTVSMVSRSRWTNACQSVSAAISAASDLQMEKQTAGTRECRLEAEEQEVTGSDSGIGIWGWRSSGQLRHSVSAQSGSTCTTSCFDITWPQLYFLSNWSWDIWIIRHCIRTLHWEFFSFCLFSWKHI